MTATLRVLIVEDNGTDARLVAYELRRTGRLIDFERVEDAPSMRAALERGQWDLVISDWSMPRFSALAALALLKETGLDLPFIIVSGTIGEDLAVEAMRAGARDYVLKGRLMRLAPAVERELRETEERARRRRAEAAIEARFRALIERSSDGIALSDADGAVIYRSPAAARLRGGVPGEEADTGGLDAVHPDDRARVAEVFAALLADPAAPHTAEFRSLHRDGSWRWLETVFTNLLGDPAVGAIVSNFRDVTERREMLELLRASEARHRQIIETTSEGVWVLDEAGRTAFANARMASMLGYRSATEILGLSSDTFLRLPVQARQS